MRGVELAPGDVLFLHALVHHGALLEKHHPGRDGRADVGHQEEEQLAVEAAGKVAGSSPCWMMSEPIGCTRKAPGM